MSAEVLREAAALMRENAEVCDPTARITVTRPQNVPHVRSWHPAVALAVADWLDLAAERSSQNPHWYAADNALAVACAYLGGA